MEKGRVNAAASMREPTPQVVPDQGDGQLPACPPPQDVESTAGAGTGACGWFHKRCNGPISLREGGSAHLVDMSRVFAIEGGEGAGQLGFVPSRWYKIPPLSDARGLVPVFLLLFIIAGRTLLGPVTIALWDIEGAHPAARHRRARRRPRPDDCRVPGCCGGQCHT